MTEADAPFLLEVLNEPAFIRNIGDRGVRTVEEARPYMKERITSQYERYGFGMLLVELTETGEPVGICGLIKRDALDDIDLGFSFLERFWSRGFASEAASAVLASAGAAHELSRVVAIVAPHNHASVRLLERLGFHFEKMVRLTGDEELKLFAIELEKTGLTSGQDADKFHDMTTNLLQQICDRHEVADTLYRYAFGLDHGDADSLASAFTGDCVLDFSPAGHKIGLDFPRLVGRQAILDALLPFLGPLDTTHTASNLQIEVSGDTATLYAYVMSQHFMPREGSRRGAENALLMNRYDCDLVRDGQKWRFNRMTIDNAWMQGDPEILNLRATHRALTARRRQAKDTDTSAKED
jgi:RimJ/RimL family protein N-acetyltransferase